MEKVKIHYAVARMPESCKQCEAPDPYGLRCTLTGSPAQGGSRPADCPLVCIRSLIRGSDPP